MCGLAAAPSCARRSLGALSRRACGFPISTQHLHGSADACGLSCSSSSSTSRAPSSQWQRKFVELNELAEGGRREEALAVFHSIRHLVPDRQQTMLWNTVLKAYAHAGDLDGAAEWFERMLASGVEVSDRTFGKLAEASAKAGRPDEAERWLRARTARGATGAVLGAVPLGTLVDACAKVGDVERAEAWMARIHVAWAAPTLATFGSLLSAHARRGDAAAARRCTEAMELDGVAPDAGCRAALLQANVAAEFASGAAAAHDGSLSEDAIDATIGAVLAGRPADDLDMDDRLCAAIVDAATATCGGVGRPAAAATALQWLQRLDAAAPRAERHCSRASSH